MNEVISQHLLLDTGAVEILLENKNFLGVLALFDEAKEKGALSNNLFKKAVYAASERGYKRECRDLVLDADKNMILSKDMYDYAKKVTCFGPNESLSKNFHQKCFKKCERKLDKIQTAIIDKTKLKFDTDRACQQACFNN